jgi:hypothetical protein
MALAIAFGVRNTGSSNNDRLLAKVNFLVEKF